VRGVPAELDSLERTGGSTGVPPGYKRTEVGVIPEDWEVTNLGELGRCLSGGTPSMADPRLWGGEIPWVSSKDMKASRLRHSIDHVTPLAIGAGTRMVHPGTIFIVVRGMSLAHSLPVALVERSMTFNQDIKAFVPTPEVSSEFLLSWFEGNQSRLLHLATEATHGTKRIPTPDLLGCRVPLPPLPEQRAIAGALSDVDELIGALDRLIAKKRAIKQATMQQLLTGKTRLPGFSGEWERRTLGEIGSFSKGRGIRRDEVTEEGLPCIRYGELYTEYGDHIVAPVSRIPPSVAETALPIRTGDLLFAGSGETAEEIGRCAAYLGEQPAFAGGDIVVWSPVGQHAAYLGYLMNHPTVTAQKARFGQGDAVVHISARSLAQVEVKLPPLAEQSAIATVLSDMDAEISALEDRRNKTRAIKQGMMQELLTGRIRLVDPEEAATA